MESSVPTYSTKENNIIQYLSGYVFSTIYGRLKFSKATQSMLGMQCLPLLLAGKSSLENSSTENDSLIRAKDRGGLWNVTPEVYFIFSQVETLFRHATTTFDKQIDGKKMVSQLLENPPTGGGENFRGGGTVFFNPNFKILSLYVFKTAQTSKSVKIINCMCL